MVLTTLESLAKEVSSSLPQNGDPRFIVECVEELLGLKCDSLKTGSGESLYVQAGRSVTAVIAKNVGCSSEMIGNVLNISSASVDTLIADFDVVKKTEYEQTGSV